MKCGAGRFVTDWPDTAFRMVWYWIWDAVQVR